MKTHEPSPSASTPAPEPLAVLPANHPLDYGRAPPAITKDTFVTRLCAIAAFLVAVPAWVLTFLCVLHTLLLLLARSHEWQFGVFRATACMTAAGLCTTIAIAAGPRRWTGRSQG